ncbi:MAG: hypothetical protein EHM20_06995 [Alphaproteobacteria bacterium]|nr:MAG: hypothetical protein EHM20_06995 [Alphaproteobacteria bacterium]
MTKNFTYLILTSLVALVILFSGCTEINNSSQAEEGLNIVESSQAIGAVDGVNDTSIQVCSYDFTLYNGENEKVYIDSVEPLFSKDFLARVLTEDHKIVVNETIEPHSSILIKGQVKFNVSGLSKEQILGFEPYISGINITSTETLLYPK